ncbi:hypothetical protein BBJ28_00021129, partial [Nothophytophthora sp. Chile5]
PHTMDRRPRELRPRAASHAGASSPPAASLSPRHASASPSSSRLRRWQRVLLASGVIYASLLLLWYIRMSRSAATAGTSGASSFPSADARYLHAHEDPELALDRPADELELEFMQVPASSQETEPPTEEDQQAVEKAEAHALTVHLLPEGEAEKRRLRCLGWRATANCSPDGPRLPSQDEPCTKVVAFGASGYCEVQDKDTNERFRVMRRHCSSLRDTARFRCSEAWDFVDFPSKARDAVVKATRYGFLLPNIAKKASKQPQPRDGIVMVVYPKLLASAYATIRALREVVHCRLPIELWFRPQEMKHFPTAFAHLQLLATTGADGNGALTFQAIDEPGVTGFATKVYAVYNSFFERVLFLDADNVPVRDPGFLFESPEFEETGAVFWPDFWHPTRTIFNIQPHSLVWELLDLPFVNMFEQESGQMVIDRRRHAAPLELVKFYTFHRPNHFDKLKLAHGDKDLFRFAWLKLGAAFHMMQSPPALAGKVVNGSFCGMTMVQHDAQGQILFLHRNSHKLMGVPKRKAVNLKAAAFRRARNKRLRMANRVKADGEATDEVADEEELSSPTLEPPEPDGYPDTVIWTHLVSFRNESRRANYVIDTYTAYPDFPAGQNCYGLRYLNQSQHFFTQEFANLSFAGLETEIRRFAMEAAQLHQGRMPDPED